MKIRQDELARDIVKLVGEDILLIPQYADLVADQREYALPTDMIASIKRVEAKLDGTNYIKLNEFDVNEWQKSVWTESEITEYFSNLEGFAYFDLFRKSIKIYSGTITDVTNGIKIYCNTWMSAIDDLSSTTDMSIDPSTTTLGIPRELHEIWARGVIIEYKESREKPIPLTERETKYEYDKKVAIKSLRPQNLDRVMVGKLPDAEYLWNNGEDL